MEISLADKRVYKAIKSVFSDFAEIGRESFAKEWKSLDKEKRNDAVRAEIYLKKVASNPQEFFSRAATERTWSAKIRAYQQHGGYKSDDRDAVAFIVGSPKTDVDNNVRPMFVKNSNLFSLFRDFTGMVQDWEYCRTSRKKADIEKAQVLANKIFEMKEKIEDKKNQKASRFVAWELLKNIKRTFGNY